MITETITWIDAQKELPNGSMTVLIFVNGTNYPIWMGYYENAAWYTIDGNQLKPGEVTHWSHLPTGPEDHD